ncbi:MAG: patatin-like phospholipase family protein, partial [Oscillospiraceae bacterium]|nr:patatin-like phospholipase family protein [Oscillospiraceae bacterium]
MKERNIGLVLDGGGGKGAYQIGVWKALRKTGLEQRNAVISGASVGGLNAALMVQGDLEKAEQIWFRELEHLRPTRIHGWVSEIIERYLDLSCFSRSEIECWLATVCTTPGQSRTQCVEWGGSLARKYQNGSVHYFNMRGCSEEERQTLLLEKGLNSNIMLATCALPLLCKSRKIDGLRYRDGGIRDNSPLCPITDIPYMQRSSQRCKTVIVIHLDPVENDHDPSLWYGTSLLQITPNTEIGNLLTGTLNFNVSNARRLAEAGYRDSLPLFRKLIENEQSEQAFLDLEEKRREHESQRITDIVSDLALHQEWKKEETIMDKTYLTENDLIAAPENLSGLGFAEKYTLLTEVSFLLEQNDAETKYLDVTGFRLVLQTLFGKQRKGRIQWMKNTQAIQCRLTEIAVMFDAELQQLKKEQYDLVKKLGTAFRRIFHTQLYLIVLTDENSLHYSEALYQQLIRDIEEAEAEMLRELAELQQKQIADREARSSFRILRLIPREQAVITPSGVTVTPTQRDRKKEEWDHIIGASEYEHAASLGEFDAVILPFGAPLGNIKARCRID